MAESKPITLVEHLTKIARERWKNTPPEKRKQIADRLTRARRAAQRKRKGKWFKGDTRLRRPEELTKAS